MACMWYADGAHMSGQYGGGAHLARWTNRRVPRGTCWLSWPNGRLPCGTDIVAGFFELAPFPVSKLYPDRLCPQVVPREACDQISALD
jgi:hypothetical protein